VFPLFLLLLDACTSDNLPVDATAQSTSRTPSLAISDAVHNGGLGGFYFLPPIVAQPAATGILDSAASPTITICAVVDGVCSATIAAYSRAGGSDGESVSMSEDGYQVNWKTSNYTLNDGSLYRIQVSNGGLTLGFADVEPLANASEFHNVRTGEIVPLLDGRTLPIRVRIEVGAGCLPAPSGMTHWWAGDGDHRDRIGGDDGTVVGNVTYAPGMVGQAFKFGDGYIRLSGVYGGESDTALTVMAWILAQAEGPDTWQGILSATTIAYVHFQTVGSYGGVALYGTGGWFEVPGPHPTPLGIWKRIALTAREGLVTLYENGAVFNQAAGPLGYLMPSSTDDGDGPGAALIGNGYLYARPFPGLIDELQVFNRELSASEVQAVVAAGPAGVCKR
jgi:hypothetical protein